MKHTAVSRYSQNTNFHGRRAQIFRYEFFQLIWLRAKGFFVEESNAYKETYIPPGVSSGETRLCGFDLLPNDLKYIYWTTNILSFYLTFRMFLHTSSAYEK